jgi:hypothetical protein
MRSTLRPLLWECRGKHSIPTIERLFSAWSSEKAPHKNKTVTVKQSWDPGGARHQDLGDWPSVAMWLWLWTVSVFLCESSDIQVSRKLEERIETRSTEEYKRSACENILCELQDFMCVIVQGDRECVIQWDLYGSHVMNTWDWCRWSEEIGV